MIDCINRQQAIDGFHEMASDTDHLCTVGDYISFLESLLSAQQQTLYGYKIEHLAYIARVMEKEGITAEYAARTFDDMSRAIRMILDEAQQKAEEMLNAPKNACSDCQEFDCYGCEHKEESK